MRHFFKDLGIHQKYSHMRILKSTSINALGQPVITFLSNAVHLTDIEVLSLIPEKCEKGAVRDMKCEFTCIETTKSNIQINIFTEPTFTFPPFIEKLMGNIIWKMCSRIKNCIECHENIKNIT
jgi:hypothetical protein